MTTFSTRFARWTNFFLVGVLLAAFLANVAERLYKVAQRRKGVVSYYKSEESFRLPSLTLCADSFGSSAYLHRQTDFWEKCSFLGRMSDRLLAIHQGEFSWNSSSSDVSAINQSLFDVSDFSELTIGNHSKSCATVRSLARSHPGVDGILSLVVDTSDMERKEMDLIVHGREVRAFRNFGVVEKLKFRSVAEVKGYELSLRKSLLMSTSDRPCSRAEENNVDECVRNFLERRIGCRLPYVPRGQEDEVCHTQEQFDEYYITFQRFLRSKEASHSSSGCVISCEQVSAGLREVADLGEEDGEEGGLADVAEAVGVGENEGFLKLFFYVYSPEVRVEEEVWHYNWLDMLADLGGLLGLLLGASCLSMSQAVLSWVEEKMKKY